MRGAAVALALLCGTAVRPVAAPPPLRVLFIGNSLTAANGLPKTVERLSKTAGAPIAATTIAENDFSLADHWDKGAALKAIRRRTWDVVVLQQGPSSLPESRAQLITDTKRFNVEIRAAGARTALFMIWPPKTRLAFAADVARSYSDASAAVNGTLLPAGDAWTEAWNINPYLALYGSDDFHPSPLGSELAALAIVRGLTGYLPVSDESPFGPVLRLAVANIFNRRR